MTTALWQLQSRGICPSARSYLLVPGHPGLELGEIGWQSVLTVGWAGSQQE